MKSKIINMKSSQIGTRIEFLNEYYTEATCELKENKLYINNRVYIVGDEVTIHLYRNKCVYDFD